MNNRNVNSQLGSVIDQLGQDKNSDQLKSDRAELDKKIVDLLMKQQSTIAGLQKGTGAAPVANTSTAKKVGNVNTGFYADVVGGSRQRLRKGDGAAGIGAKIYSVIRQDIEHRKLKTELKHNFQKENFDSEEKRQKELIDTIKGRGKPKVPKPGRDEKGRFVKKTPEEAPAGKAPAPAGKPAAPAPAPAGKPAAPAPKVETKPVTAVKTPQVKTPEVKPPTVTKAPEVTKIIPSAVKVAVVGGGLAAVLNKAESSDYNQLVYPKKQFIKDVPSKAKLTDMYLSEVLAYQKTMNDSGKYPSSAVGKYQIIRSTLEEAIKFLKLDPKTTKFDKETQDLIYKRYLISGKRVEIEDFVTGKSNDLVAAQLALAKEFASFSVPEDVLRPKGKNWEERLVKKGESYYIGAAGNQASVTPEQSAQALFEERELRLNKKTNTAEEASVKPAAGQKLAQDSIEHIALKNKSGQTTVIMDNSTTNNLAGGKSTTQTLHTPTPSEKPAILGN